jgi:hypothetical protein
VLQYERKLEKKRNKINSIKLEREVEAANLKEEIERLMNQLSQSYNRDSVVFAK